MGYLTDSEKRLLFSALTREKGICKVIDEEKENGTLLTPIVESLERKFYYDRFEKQIRNDVIDRFSKIVMEEFTKFDLEHGYPTIADVKTIVRDVSEKMKEVDHGKAETKSPTGA